MGASSRAADPAAMLLIAAAGLSFVLGWSAAGLRRRRRSHTIINSGSFEMRSDLAAGKHEVGRCSEWRCTATDRSWQDLRRLSSRGTVSCCQTGILCADHTPEPMYGAADGRFAVSCMGSAGSAAGETGHREFFQLASNCG